MLTRNMFTMPIVSIHAMLCLFCFSLCVSNLLLKLIGIVNIFRVNIHKFFRNFLKHIKLTFFKWVHGCTGALDTLPVALEGKEQPRLRKNIKASERHFYGT